MAYTSILVEAVENVGLIRLNRPQQLNALNSVLMEELATALEAFDRDDQIRCIVITGNERAFAAGADIKEMAEASAVEMLLRDNISRWDRIQRIRKPIIAAVSGWCLGGGCELAMACDIIIASETAVFGQPEINIGVMPGRWGNPAPDPGDRQIEGDGDDPHRTLHERPRSRGRRAGLPRGPGGNLPG